MLTRVLALGGLAACLLLSVFVDLRWVHGSVDIPVADLLAMALSLGWGVSVVARTRSLRASAREVWAMLPAAGPWSAFLGASVVTSFLCGVRGWMLHFIARKPLFSWAVYGAGVAGVAEALPTPWLLRLGLVHAFWLSGLILPPAFWLLFYGYGGAILDLPGLINNHKVFAVALAPWVGAILRWRPLLPSRGWAAVVWGGSVVAVLASMSKAAWITAAFGGLAFVEVRGRPLIARPGVGLGGALAGIGAMTAFPFVVGASVMAEAIDSRWSLNLRAWQMFTERPLYGYGPDTSVRWLMADLRHARINGVDAHGVFQKVLAEGGLLGGVPYALAYLWLLRCFWRAAVGPSRAASGAGILGLGLQLNLLLSTDYFSSAHWAPLAVALAIVAKEARTAAGDTRARQGAGEP